MDHEALRSQLNKQLGFVERSCASFDAGYEDEAIRIAVSIRILLHNTRNSTSLLAQVRAKEIFLRSTCPLIDEKTIYYSGGLCSAQIKIENGRLLDASYKPILDSSEPKSLFINSESWWNQIIYRINEGEVTRRQIALGAANKDGGAHVDPTLTAEYEALCRGVMRIGHSSAHETIEFPLPNSHLADLRQMGHELLTSPNLITLAAKPT